MIIFMSDLGKMIP